MTLSLDAQDAVAVLREAKVVAVLGLHRDGMKPAHYVPEYLHRQGYTILGVNPALAARGVSLFGHRVVASLSEIETPVDVVDVFRRSDKLGAHLPDILAMPHPPKAVWFQLGIRNDEVARALREQGIKVIQDRCMLTDHRQYL